MSAPSRLDRTRSSRSMRFRPSSRITVPGGRKSFSAAKLPALTFARVSVPYRQFATRWSPRITQQTGSSIAERLRGN